MIIGEWIEAARDVRQCPSYYAADWETLRTKAGRYPVSVRGYGSGEWNGRDWPQSLSVKIDADRIAGTLYSGFAGLNFASSDLPLEPKPLFVSPYAYALPELIDQGSIELSAEGAELMCGWITRWRESSAKLAREREEIAQFRSEIEKLSGYVLLRLVLECGHSYACDIHVRQNGQPEPSAEEIATGDRISAAALASRGYVHADRIAALRASLSEEIG